jgi:hypothetical protein
MAITESDLSPSLRHWFRSVMGNKDGALVHDGDCRIYDMFVRVCTCGLFHALHRLDHDQIQRIYPKYNEETISHDASMGILRANRGL